MNVSKANVHKHYPLFCKVGLRNKEVEKNSRLVVTRVSKSCNHSLESEFLQGSEMKLVSFEHKSQQMVGSLSVDQSQINFNDNLSGNLIGLPQSCGLPNLSPQTLEQALGQSNAAIDLADVTLKAPVEAMEKLICVGTNYADHAKEMGSQVPELPIIFNKFPSCIVGPESEIKLPQLSQKVDFEAELVVVIGVQGKHIAKENAMDHVLGYCCGNDISARDWQKGKPGGQWLLGKAFDTFAPLGPMIVTKDEIPDPYDLGIRLRLNGELMQDSNTSHLIFPIDFLISHLSQFVTLRPGDLLFTGTPPGVGAGRKPQLFLKPGDQLEVEIDGLGVLRNKVVADS